MMRTPKEKYVDHPAIVINGKKITSLRQTLWDLNLSAKKLSELSGQPLSTIYNWIRGVYKTPPIVFWALNLYGELNSKKGGNKNDRGAT